jgi:hypothetical protein
MKLLIIAIPFYLIPILSLAQQAKNDSLFYNFSIDFVKQNYTGAVKESLPIYNGGEYIKYIPRTKGHPYFYSDSFVKGNIFYQGVLYENVSMQYDLVYDKVLLRNYPGDFIMTLGSEKIKYFIIANHIFERQEVVSEIFNNQPGVFLERVYAGKSVTGYVKTTKVFLPPLRAEDSIPSYRAYTNYYVKKDDKLYPVSSIRKLIAVLNESKDMLKAFVSDNSISMGKIDNETMIQVLDYYEQLKK